MRMEMEFIVFNSVCKIKILISLITFLILLNLSVEVGHCADSSPPQVKSLSYTPSIVDVSSQAQTINFSSQVIDDVSGVSWGYLRLNSPSGNQFAEINPHLTSGNKLDGTWAYPITIPKSSEPGTWYISSIHFTDNLNTNNYLTEAQLIALGFPTKVQVTSLSKPGDCDGNGIVTISEVQSAINMFLGLKTAAACVNLEINGAISIAEVQKVINSFLGL